MVGRGRRGVRGGGLSEPLFEILKTELILIV